MNEKKLNKTLSQKSKKIRKKEKDFEQKGDKREVTEDQDSDT
jgi:hypothetical protein